MLVDKVSFPQFNTGVYSECVVYRLFSQDYYDMFNGHQHQQKNKT